ncbi:MAG: 50S ribosomal protein L28 [Clostridia bacterium]|nr:50S ribosomal protein L28 [Clostridia bacterium]
MAKCEICQKESMNGNKLSITRSHISKRSARTWKPNLRSVKAEVNGEVKRIHVCAKCLKNGKVKRVS